MRAIFPRSNTQRFGHLVRDQIPDSFLTTDPRQEQMNARQSVQTFLEAWFTRMVEFRLTDAMEAVTEEEIVEFLDEKKGRGAIRKLMAISRATAGQIYDDLFSVAVAAGEAETLDIGEWGVSGAETLKAIIAKKTLRFSFVFNRADPWLVRAMNSNRADFIKQITESQRSSIKTALADGVAAFRMTPEPGHYALNPREIARSFRSALTLTDGQMKWASNYRNALVNQDARAFSSYTLRDHRFDSSTRKAFASGKGLSNDAINKRVAAYQRRLLKYRAEVIGRSEALRAVSVGRHAAWSQAIEKGAVDKEKVVRFWVTAGDERVRADHTPIPGMNANGRGQDEPFRTNLGPLLYPRDPAGEPANIIQCRCELQIKIKRAKKSSKSEEAKGREQIKAASSSLPKRQAAKPRELKTEKVAEFAGASHPFPAARPTDTMVTTTNDTIPLAQIGRQKLPDSLSLPPHEAILLRGSQAESVADRMSVSVPPVPASLSSPDPARLIAGKVAAADVSGEADLKDVAARVRDVKKGLGGRRWTGLSHSQRTAAANAGLQGEYLDATQAAKSASAKLMSPHAKPHEEFDELSSNLVMFAAAVHAGALTRVVGSGDLVDGNVIYRISNSKGSKLSVNNAGWFGALAASDFREVRRVTEHDGVELVDVIPE